MVAPRPGTIHPPAPPARPRKVIQMTAASYDNSVAMTALCDDGTMWDFIGGRWVELPAIPQDESQDPLANAVSKLQIIQNHADAWRDSPSLDKQGVANVITSILKGR